MSTMISESAAFDTARQYVYRFLSLLLSDPRSMRWQNLYDVDFQSAAVAAGDVLCEEVAGSAAVLAPGELSSEHFDLKGVLLFLQSHEAMLGEYQQTFGLMVSKKCPPYETEYCPQTFSVYRSQQLADIAGFYRAFGLEPSRDLPERQDHIALELEFMAWLIAKEIRAGNAADQAAACREAQQSFFRDHVAWWIPAFALALRRRADRVKGLADISLPPQSFYGALAKLLASFVYIERVLLRTAPPTELMIPQATADTEPNCEDCCGVAASADATK